jgi:hypothetical protein
MMESFVQKTPESRRPPYRPPIGIPTRGEARAQATVAAILLHALLFLLLIAPTLLITASVAEQYSGAGGAGPAGGGGGGNSGTGGSRVHFVREQLRYVRLSTPEDQLKVPVEEKKPKAEEKKPPEPEKKPEPEPKPPEDSRVNSADSGSSVVKGVGGGSGNDGTAGNGPGSGGGVGSGVGSGRGSANGPGTGGGEDMVYPPSVVALPILPLPVPSKVRPYKMVAQFEVDSSGNARLLGFNPSRDSGYNKRIREMLMEIRFRPAVRLDGRPIRAVAVITAEAM